MTSSTKKTGVGTQTPAIRWETPSTWEPDLAAWLGEFWLPSGLNRMRGRRSPGSPWDDPIWLKLLERYTGCEIDYLAEAWAADWGGRFIRVYHGCRTEDAGTYFRNGIKPHDRAELVAAVWNLVRRFPDLRNAGPGIEQRLDRINREGTDQGRVFLALDHRNTIERDGHYVIYGSEFIGCVLGDYHRRLLRRIGAPTFIEVDLPLSSVLPGLQIELGKRLFAEWTRRQLCRPDRVPILDFTFTLHGSVKAEWIVGHSHPTRAFDCWDGNAMRELSANRCAHCREVTSG